MSALDNLDLQISVEADLLVNLYEDGESADAVRKAYDKSFATDTGRKICREMYGL